MNNFDKIRTETATMEGMAKTFISSDWESKGYYFSKHAARYFDSEKEVNQAEIKWLQQENGIGTDSCVENEIEMKLKDIIKYMVEDYSVEVEDATDDKFDHVVNFMSNDKDKMELYKNAKVTTILPFSNSCIQINVCINY